MLWLICGIIIGFTWHWLLTWSRAKGIRISWLVWFLLIFTCVAGLSGIQNFFALMEEYEERAAWIVIPVYSIQVLIPAALAGLLLWRSARRARG